MVKVPAAMGLHPFSPLSVLTPASSEQLIFESSKVLVPEAHEGLQSLRGKVRKSRQVKYPDPYIPLPLTFCILVAISIKLEKRKSLCACSGVSKEREAGSVCPTQEWLTGKRRDWLPHRKKERA